MYQRKSRRYGALMLAVSICLRLCMFLGLDAKAAAFLSDAAKNREFARWMLFLETGQAVSLPEEAPERLFVLEILPEQSEKEEAPAAAEEGPAPAPVAQAPVSAPAPLPLAQASAISVAGGCTYAYDKAALLARPSQMDFSGPGPHVLIVHTHGSEAYTPTVGTEYTPSTAYRTLETDKSVIRVGAVLAETLKENGISVIHDTKINDYPSYNTSYWTTLQQIEAWKTRYPNIQMVIDIHRDAAVDDAGNAVALSARAGGESCARLMLVVGTDQGGLSHPNWQENLANALKLQSVLEGAYPGLCRSMDLRTERFNQHAAPGSILVEVGTHGNTLPQAMASAELLGRSIAQMIAAMQDHGGKLHE